VLRFRPLSREQSAHGPVLRSMILKERFLMRAAFPLRTRSARLAAIRKKSKPAQRTRKIASAIPSAHRARAVLEKKFQPRGRVSAIAGQTASARFTAPPPPRTDTRPLFRWGSARTRCCCGAFITGGSKFACAILRDWWRVGQMRRARSEL